QRRSRGQGGPLTAKSMRQRRTSPTAPQVPTGGVQSTRNRRVEGQIGPRPARVRGAVPLMVQQCGRVLLTQRLPLLRGRCGQLAPTTDLIGVGHTYQDRCIVSHGGTEPDHLEFDDPGRGRRSSVCHAVPPRCVPLRAAGPATAGNGPSPSTLPAQNRPDQPRARPCTLVVSLVTGDGRGAKVWKAPTGISACPGPPPEEGA